MKKIVFLSLVMLVISIASCQNQTINNNNTGKIINATISVNDFEEKLNKNSNVQLIDVRTPEEFNQGHLKTALNYNINSSEFETQIAKLNKAKPVLVYCLSGGRSASAAELISEKGFLEVYNMQGGIMKWNANNKPLDNETVIPVSKGLSMEEFNTLLKTEKYVLVDYNAKWCKPCIKMTPMLDSFSENRKEKLSLLKIDADENKKLLEEKHIESIPALEIYKNGKLIWKHEGEIDEATLIKETKL
ncbi:MAG: rhodanese-like domain-containing protein [Bacteroidia bacterium]